VSGSFRSVGKANALVGNSGLVTDGLRTGFHVISMLASVSCSYNVAMTERLQARDRFGERLSASRGGYPGIVTRQSQAIANFSGEIDFTTRDEIRSRLESLREAELAIVDLSDVSYMDSIALAELVLLHRARSQAGKSPPRVVIGPRIARLYEISGLQLVLPSYGSVAEAQA
jgi:anti-sigma B factor antagonist